MHVVAHSMGGLIAKSFAARYQTAELASINSFTTLGTPWGGHNAAQVGVDYAPAVVPVWHDLIPDSAFLQSLRSEGALGPPHTLIFGYGGSGLSTVAHDGVLTVTSQLENVAQSQATKVYGFDVDHAEILADDRVIAVILNALTR